MKYLRVKNWQRFQHPSEKPLPWIKFFTALLVETREPAYSDLPDATKALLHHIWLMARVHANRIPETWLTSKRLNLKSRINLRPLLELGYIWFENENGEILDSLACAGRASGVLDSKSLSLPEGECEGEGFDSERAFDGLWGDHPRPIGRKEAYKHFCATVKSPEDLAAIRTALANYKASGEVARGYVQHGRTWFNNWRDWVNVAPPAKSTPDGVTLPPRTRRDVLLDLIDAYRAKVGPRPQNGSRAEWDEGFKHRFGFYPEAWNAGIVTDEQIEAALAVTA